MNRPAILLLLVGLVGCHDRAPAPPATGPATPPPATATGRLSPALDLELAYLSTRDLYKKIEIMEALTEVAPAEGVLVFGRLFYFEEDPELREELLYSLMDIPGATDAKRALLEEALQPGLPAGVRFMAIDLLVELGDSRAATALQEQLADPDQQIRQAVEEALQDLP